MQYTIGQKINTTDGEAIIKTIIQDATGYSFGVVFLNEDGSEKIDTRYYAEKYTGDNPAPHKTPEEIAALVETPVEEVK